MIGKLSQGMVDNIDNQDMEDNIDNQDMGNSQIVIMEEATQMISKVAASKVGARCVVIFPNSAACRVHVKE